MSGDGVYSGFIVFSSPRKQSFRYNRIVGAEMKERSWPPSVT
jgi:hypothetical protein